MKWLTLVTLSIALAAQAQAQALEFRPYDPAAPAATVDGSIRGADNDLALTLLAPPQLAATASATPALYWHASDDVTVPVELVVVAEGGVEPLMLLRMEPPVIAGVHRFVVPAETALDVGQFYQWSVAAIPDEESRSSDVFASALLQRVAGPQVSPNLNLSDRAGQLAAAGIWYDTLDLLALAAADDPQAMSLRRQLLEQAGLQKFADAQWRNSK